MTEKYELTTLRDIFEKVPADRIEDCCAEIGALLAQTKHLMAPVLALGPAAVQACFPEPITWVDDGKGEVTTNVRAGIKGQAEQVLSYTLKMRNGVQP